MKIKDLKSKKVVSEIQLSSFGLGDYGSALGKQLVGKGGGLTKQDLMTQNIYIKNFVSNALSNLNNAIKSGLVDPKKVDPSKATAADFPTTKQMQPGDLGMTNPAQPNQTSAQAPAQAPAQAQAQAPAKAPAQAQPQAPKGTTVPRQTVSQKVAAQKAAQKAASQPKQPFAQKAAAAKQKQANIKAKAIKNQPVKPVAPKLRESSYDRLNALFEHILETVLPQQSNTQSVKDYLKTVWLPGYLKGVNWKPNEQQIDKILQQVQDTYAKDGGRGALNQLASLSFSITPRSQPKTKKQKATKPATEPAAKTADDDAIVATWGGIKYTKTMSGWKDKNGKLADANTAKILDQAVAQDTGEPPPTKPKGPTAPAAGPAAGAAQQADNSNVIPFKKTA